MTGILQQKQRWRRKKGLKMIQAILDLICGTGILQLCWYCWMEECHQHYWQHHYYIWQHIFCQYKHSGEVHGSEEESKCCQVKNLTISYGGSTTKAVKSIYMIHITTPHLQQAYLIEGNEAWVCHIAAPKLPMSFSRLILCYVTAACIQILLCFSRSWIASARRIFQGYPWIALEIQNWPTKICCKASPWIIILPDVCHLLNHMAKDIGKFHLHWCDTQCGLDTEQLTCSWTDNISSLLHYQILQKSSYAKWHLAVLQIYFDIKKGLVAVRNTWCLTLCYSGSSLRHCLPPIKELMRASFEAEFVRYHICSSYITKDLLND